MAKEKFINVNELQNNTSEIFKNLNKGVSYVVLRYSDPAGALISYDSYKKMITIENEFVNECKGCLSEIKDNLNSKDKKNNKGNENLHIVAVTGFVEFDNKFLILKRSENETAYPGKWTIPGGKAESGLGVIDNLKREIKEESNLDVEDSIIFLGDSEFIRPDGLHVFVLRFLCKAKKDNLKISDDFTDHAWITLDQLESFDLIDGVKKDFLSLQKVFK